MEVPTNRQKRRSFHDRFLVFTSDVVWPIMLPARDGQAPGGQVASLHRCRCIYGIVRPPPSPP